jgi:hypothetical protein
MDTITLAMLKQLREDAEAMLRRKYVARADERQKAIGLSYVTVETNDLAHFIAAFAFNRITDFQIEAAIAADMPASAKH